MSADPDGPTRLLDPASGAPESLREILASADGDAPSAIELGRLAERLAPLVGAPVAAATAAGATGAGATSAAATAAGASAGTLSKVVIGLGLTALLGGSGAALVWSQRGGGHQAPTREPARAPGAASTAVPGRAPAPAPVPTAAATPIVEGAAPHQGTAAGLPEEPLAARPARTRAHAAPPAPVLADVPINTTSEVDLLGMAHQALRDGVPARALELARAHEVRFPAGALAEEREAIAVEALARLSRAADAGVRFTSFVKRFPTSSYRPRLAKLVGH